MSKHVNENFSFFFSEQMYLSFAEQCLGLIQQLTLLINTVIAYEVTREVVMI
jgi:hypothetical protein